LREVGRVVHQFSNEHGQQGFTLVFCLAESHLALHTWPERSYATLDVHLCGAEASLTQPCRELFHAVARFLQPNRIHTTELKR
jgi:S-adenosylmethionine/arginine decarboxylase-like enzyme